MSELATTAAATPAARTPAQDLVAWVRTDHFTEQIAMVLPENVPPSRFVRATVTAVLANPDVATLDTDSVMNALLRAAQDGLLPDGREAALVGYKGKAQYLPMVGGIRRIAAEHGWTIITGAVRAADQFEYELGLEPKLAHRPASGDRGDLVYAYAVAKHRDGRKEIAVMDAVEVAKVRKVSRASDKGPWVQWEERMWEKSVAHRIFKQLSLDPGDRRVASIIDAERLDAGEAAGMLYGPHGATFRVADAEVVGRAALEAGTPDAPADGGGGTDGTQERAAGQQAAAGESSGDTSPAPAAAPGASVEPPAPPAAEPSPFQAPDAAVDAAGAHAVQTVDGHSGWNGRTVADICADVEYGHQWIAWLWANPGAVTADSLAALRLYVSARHPELTEEQT